MNENEFGNEKIVKIEIINDGLIAFDDKYQDIAIGGCTPKDIAFAIKINEIIEKLNNLIVEEDNE